MSDDTIQSKLIIESNEDFKKYEINCSENISLIHHPYECSSFYLCAGGIAYFFSCKGGYYFDKDILSCRICDECVRNLECPYVVEELNKSITFPSPNFCEYYYECKFGYINFKKCNVGERYINDNVICSKI